MKKIAAVIAVLSVVVLGILLINCRMTSYYNKGNKCYVNKQYDQAILYYDEALKWFPSKNDECAIRINMALARLQKIDYSNAAANPQPVINELEEIKGILCEKGCAHMNDENGHDEVAQRLKDEIDMIEQAILEAQATEDGNSGNDSQSEEQQQDDSNSQQKEDLEQQLKESQENAAREREEWSDFYESSGTDIFDNDGPCW